MFEKLRNGKRDTRTPERMPGTVETKTERSVDGEIGKEEVNPTKVADERVRRLEAGDGTASPKSISSIGERRAEQSKLKDKERQENKKAVKCVRRYGSIKARNKQVRGYTERKEVGNTKAGTKRGRPNKMDGSGTGGSDTERRGGRKKRKQSRSRWETCWRVSVVTSEGWNKRMRLYHVTT